MFRRCSIAVAGGLVGLVAYAGPASTDELSVDTLRTLSVEELMNLEVTSVSRRPEKWGEAPAAIQVITAEDIRRAGVDSLPEALRLATNLSVARENSHEWVISARGFSSDVGNKLLVLIDGRTVYTPLFSGVFWDRQDYLLEDIERIEVISGPGGALWGANAVNGVISITTKQAHDTQGAYVEAGGGTSLRTLAGARYGGNLSDDVAWRVYGKYTDRDDEVFADGQDAGDAWQMGQTGFRMDGGTAASANTWTLQGDFYRIEGDSPTGGTGRVTGSNLLARWNHTVSETSEMNLQLYYDHTDLELPVPAAFFAPDGTFHDDLDTYDLDFQHSFRGGPRHRWLWGAGFRFTHDFVRNAPALAFFPERLDQRLYSAFIQDEIALRDDVALTLGTKVEHNDYTGYEVEPSVRMRWTLAPSHSLWGAISRAVRTPSRIDRDISQPAPGFLIVILQGGESFHSEELLAYELGYRAQIGSALSLAASAFYNDYSELRSTSMSPLDPIFNLPFPFFFENDLEGHTHGLELSARYEITPRWRLKGGYNFLQHDLSIAPGGEDFNNRLNESADPEHQLSLRSSVDLGTRVELDGGLRWVDRRTINDAGVPATVPEYLEADLRLGWMLRHDLELSIVGQNLVDDHHPEFGVPGPGRVEIGRSVYAKLVWSR